MKYFRAVKIKAIYDRKYDVFCYITNSYLILILNIIYLDFILTFFFLIFFFKNKFILNIQSTTTTEINKYIQKSIQTNNKRK